MQSKRDLLCVSCLLVEVLDKHITYRCDRARPQLRYLDKLPSVATNFRGGEFSGDPQCRAGLRHDQSVGDKSVALIRNDDVDHGRSDPVQLLHEAGLSNWSRLGCLPGFHRLAVEDGDRDLLQRDALLLDQLWREAEERTVPSVLLARHLEAGRDAFNPVWAMTVRSEALSSHFGIVRRVRGGISRERDAHRGVNKHLALHKPFLW
jgi:hypothetical protein